MCEINSWVDKKDLQLNTLNFKLWVNKDVENLLLNYNFSNYTENDKLILDKLLKTFNLSHAIAIIEPLLTLKEDKKIKLIKNMEKVWFSKAYEMLNN